MNKPGYTNSTIYSFLESVTCAMYFKAAKSYSDMYLYKLY